MIITVTLNPCYDKVAETGTLLVGELNRLENIRMDGSGKGVNVSLTIQSLGGNSVAAGFIGIGGEGILQRLEESQIQHHFVPVQSRTRTNLKVLDANGIMTELNEPGLIIEQDEWKQLFETLASYAAPGNVFTLSGSLPRNADTNTYLLLAQMLQQKGATIVLDTDGEPFRLALKTNPAFIKPNRFELLQHFSAEPDGTLTQLRNLCRQLLAQGPKAAVLSMGADGAMYVDAETCLYAPGLPVKPHSSAGAGDAIVAVMTMALHEGRPLHTALPLAVAASAGAVTTQGTRPASSVLVNQLLQKVEIQIIE